MFLHDWIRAFWRAFRIPLLILYTLMVIRLAGQFLPRIPIIYRIVCGVKVVRYTPPAPGEIMIRPQVDAGRTNKRRGG